MEESFYIDGEVIPSIVNRLDRWYDSRLSDRGQVVALRKYIVKALSTTDKVSTYLPGKFEMVVLAIWACATHKATFDCV